MQVHHKSRNNIMKSGPILAILVLGSAHAFSVPKVTRAFSKVLPPLTKTRRGRLLPARCAVNFRGGGRGSQLKESNVAEVDPEDVASIYTSFMVLNTIEATKDLAMNWGFVLNAGIVKIIGGLLAFAAPIYATEAAYGAITLALALVASFNLAGLFMEQKGFRLKSGFIGAVQGFLAYRMQFQPFEGLNILTTIVAASSMVHGAFETAVAMNNRELNGWWALLFSGLGSIAAGAVVLANLPSASLVVLGWLLGADLVTSGWSSIFSANFGREIANHYLESADYTNDAIEAIRSAESSMSE